MLALLRAAVIALVVLAMLRPTLIYTQTKKQAATLVVLADQSRSMSVPDAVGNKTRWEALRGALADAAPALAKLAARFRAEGLHLRRRRCTKSAPRGARSNCPTSPTGQQTAIGAALEDVLRREAGKRLLGVVLLSDGAQRAYAPRDLPPQTAAARLKHLGYPLFTFPFGQSRGLGEAQDVAVKDLVVNPNVFVKNELTISGQVRVDGYVNVDIPVRVLFETAPGKMEVVAQQTIRATADGQLLPVKLSYIPQVPGEYKLTLEAVEQPGELVTTNNRAEHVRQRAQGRAERAVPRRGAAGRSRSSSAARSTPRPTSRSITCGSIPAIRRAGRPISPIASSRASTTSTSSATSTRRPSRGDELAELAECVSRGAGLIMLGGFQSFGPGGYGDTPLAKVLPVGMDRLERQQPDEPLRTDLHWPGPLRMQPTPLGLMHFALMLAGNRRENEALWSKLPPLEGANKFHDLAPGAVVLAEAGADKPLLVAHNFGDGRVMAFAGDSTWRWWMHGYESAFKRFWRQIVLWLAQKGPGAGGTFGFSSPAAAACCRRSGWSSPWAPTRPPASRSPTPPTRPRSSCPTAPAGRCRWCVRTSRWPARSATRKRPATTPSKSRPRRRDQPLGTARARFLVFQQDLELDNASADAATLESLAAMTGGQCLPPSRLPDLIRRLTEETQHLDVQQETKKTFWDTWPFFLTLVGLLGWSGICGSGGGWCRKWSPLPLGEGQGEGRCGSLGPGVRLMPPAAPAGSLERHRPAVPDAVPATASNVPRVFGSPSHTL